MEVTRAGNRVVRGPLRVESEAEGGKVTSSALSVPCIKSTESVSPRRRGATPLHVQCAGKERFGTCSDGLKPKSSHR